MSGRRCEDGNGLQFEKIRLNFSSCFHASSKIDINGLLCFSLRIMVISSFGCSMMMLCMV